MRYRDRPYDDVAGDFKRLWDFLVRDYADRDGDVTWTVGRMADWKYNLASPRKLSPLFTSKSAHLWFDDLGELVACAIDESLDEDITVLVRRGLDHLFAPVLDWCVAHWTSFAQPWNAAADAPSEDPEAPACRLVVQVRESGSREAALLASRGWRDLGRRATTRQFDVAAKAREPIDLPEGFHIVSMAQDPSFRSKIALYHDAWHAGDPVTALDVELLEYSRTAPTYELGLDLSVVAPDGEHVAGATAFPDYANGHAEIERVATLSAYRRRGLATAVIGACFRALDARGLRDARITGESADAIRLYGKLGATAEWHSRVWELVIPRGAGDRGSAAAALTPV
jgi:ribosomal protein S18 acetylase RimI-like enzyme